MKRTTVNAKRFPRKLKKEIVKTFGLKSYKKLLNSNLFVAPKIISFLPYEAEKSTGWKDKNEGWGIFFKLDGLL